MSSVSLAPSSSVSSPRAPSTPTLLARPLEYDSLDGAIISGPNDGTRSSWYEASESVGTGGKAANRSPGVVIRELEGEEGAVDV